MKTRKSLPDEAVAQFIRQAEQLPGDQMWRVCREAYLAHPKSLFTPAWCEFWVRRSEQIIRLHPGESGMAEITPQMADMLATLKAKEITQ